MKKVLIVEDNEMMIEFLGNYLAKSYEIVTCSKASEVFREIMKANHPDIILADFNIPYINGLELIQKLQELELDIPVMMISGKKDVDTKIQCFEQGAVDYVQKPFNPRELQIRVQRVLDRRVYLN